MIIMNCPVCGYSLEMWIPGYFRCKECNLMWTLEDLEYEDVQDKIDKWI